MTYQLTDAEFSNLQRIAGGLNYNRIGQTGERFTASVLAANADQLNDTIARFKKPDEPSVPPVTDPPNLPPPTAGAALPYLGDIATGDTARHEYGGFGCWKVIAPDAGHVTVYEFGGPTSLRELSVSSFPGDFTGSTGGMQATAQFGPGTWYINTRIINPQEGVSYGSACEVTWHI